MKGQSLTDMKTAASNAIDLLIWPDQTKRTSRVALVPFAQDVRLPTATAYTAATGMLAQNASKNVYGYEFSINGNNLCAAERQGADRYLDTAPTAASRPIASWDYTNGKGPSDADCDVPANAAMHPLSSDKTSLHARVNGLQTAGSTAGHIGTTWAWYMLSPNFKNLWETANQPADYDRNYNVNTLSGDISKQKIKKYAILMTDGDYNIQYTSNAILTSWFREPAANDSAANQATALCTNMKAQGIEVYTIAFAHDAGLSTAAQTVLKGCATKDPNKADDTSHFYLASDGDALNRAFKDIALKISKIRVAG
jgi:hypothetical protein